jgi:hypothetical protein
MAATAGTTEVPEYVVEHGEYVGYILCLATFYGNLGLPPVQQQFFKMANQSTHMLSSP